MSSSVGKMRIGEVHAQLRLDYPDIELSKIRYYEDKGLVEPARSRKGYRLYSDRDVQCLREAIRLAQQEFVPLRVVRLRLIEQGLLSDNSPVAVVRQVASEHVTQAVTTLAPREAVRPSTYEPPALSEPDASRIEAVAPAPTMVVRGSSDGYLTLREFLRLTDLDERMLQQLADIGLITPTLVARETVYTNADVQVATTAKGLLARGVDVRILGGLRRVVDRELGLATELVESLSGPGSSLSADDLTRIVREVSLEVAILRAALYERASRNQFDI